MPARLPFLIAVVAVALSGSACGRRGALEAPGLGPDPAADRAAAAPASSRSLPGGIGIGGGAAAPDPNAVRSGDELGSGATAPGGTDVPLTTTRGAKRGFRVPKEPFFLDGLL